MACLFLILFCELNYTLSTPSSFAAYLYNPSLQQELIPRSDWPPKVDSYCVREIINQLRMLGI